MRRGWRRRLRRSLLSIRSSMHWLHRRFMRMLVNNLRRRIREGRLLIGKSLRRSMLKSWRRWRITLMGCLQKRGCKKGKLK